MNNEEKPEVPDIGDVVYTRYWHIPVLQPVKSIEDDEPYYAVTSGSFASDQTALIVFIKPGRQNVEPDGYVKLLAKLLFPTGKTGWCNLKFLNKLEGL